MVGALAIVAALTTAAPPPARSAAAVRQFRQAQPCPSTGRTLGACPGWEVDHVTPLKCGGSDHPRNLQWLTTEQHRAKTAREAKLRCRPAPHQSPE